MSTVNLAFAAPGQAANTVPPGAFTPSQVVNCSGGQRVAISVETNAAATMILRPCLDLNGQVLVPEGQQTVALAADEAGTAGLFIGHPFNSFYVVVQNTSDANVEVTSATATLSND